MSKGKKIYCIASFAFACAVLILTITLCMMHPGRVYASSMDPDSITKITQKDTQGADHNTDNANGLSITYNNDSGSVSTPIKMLLVLTILSLAPSILIMMTSFTRIIIVLHFLRTAIGTQTTPPNQVLIGLALFLTFFIMWPTFQQINKEAIQPLDKGEITQSEFFEKAEGPIREFMIKDAKIQIRDVNLFAEISGETYKDTKELSDVPFTTLVPAFILSELRKAFIMGFLIYIPFIVIDMGTATTVSVVNGKKQYIGGMILPGIGISLDALTARASQLSGISIDAPKHVIGRNTIECMKSGVLYSNAAAIDGIIDRVEEELGEKATVIATGGLAKKIVSHCKKDIILDEDLLLKGLLIIYEKNK